MQIKKILSYDVYAGASDAALYGRVCALLEQTIDPETVCPDTLDCKNQHVLVSPRIRAKTCIATETAKSISETPTLNEVPFKLSEFCKEDAFLKHGSIAVREAFIKAFVANKLALSHTELQDELDTVLALCLKPTPPLCVSHTFRMKLLEVYSTIGEELFRNPECIRNYVNPYKHLYSFGEVIELV